MGARWRLVPGRPAGAVGYAACGGGLGPWEGQALRGGGADAGAAAGGEEGEAVHQPGVPALEGDGQLAAPGDGQEEDGERGARRAERRRGGAPRSALRARAQGAEE